MEPMTNPCDDNDVAVFGDADPFQLAFDLVRSEFVDGPLSDDSDAEPLPAGYAARLDQLLDELSEDEAALARQAAKRARAVDQARLWALVSDEFVLADARMSETEREEWVMRVFLSEVATRLRVPEASAGRLVEDSRVLVHELPATLDALSLATISYRHALVIVEQAKTLPEHVRAAFEQAVLKDAVRLPVTQFRRRAVRARERIHPESIDDRVRSAVAERRFVLEPDLDGMAWLHHHLPAAQAHAAFSRVTDIAASLQWDGEQRTLAQLRSDVAADLLLEGIPDGSATPDAPVSSAGRGEQGGPNPTQGSDRATRAWGIRPTVIVTVPVLTLLGKSDEPAHLDGYGPIDRDTARRLAGRATSFIRLLTHPETGAVLSLGRDRYAVPKDLRTWLEIRDETCRFPGCGRAASRADIDHTQDWAKGGRTDAANLACLCEPHHRMKHTTRWRVMQRGDGVLDWRSPTGRVHTTRPAVEFEGTSVPKTTGPLAKVGGPRTGGSPPGDDPPF